MGKTNKNPVAQKLVTIINKKKTNLCVSADVDTKQKLLDLADKVGPHICILKTHMDIVTGFDADLIVRLKDLAQKHNFLIMEDRKFCDIGNTVYQQYTGGDFKIAEWADIVIAHAIPGPGVIDGLIKGFGDKERACLLIAQMSSAENLITPAYTKNVVELAKKYSKHVIGFITQNTVGNKHPIYNEEEFFNITPGVNLVVAGDKLGQQYRTPDEAIGRDGCDIIIVGRGIIQSSDQREEAKKYHRISAWAYFNRRGIEMDPNLS